MTIKLIAFDVDGTLTDGGIYIGQSGELFKKFNVKDGYGIHSLMPHSDLIPVIITGRVSKIVDYRCKELGIKHVYQGVSDKVDKLKSISGLLNITLSEMAYLGDDVNDLGCIHAVGYSGCPNDAVDSLKQSVDYVCVNVGGQGAAREFIEHIIELNSNAD